MDGTKIPQRSKASDLIIDDQLCSHASFPAEGPRMQLSQLKRREFVTLLGGATIAWPFATHAQQPERMRRIGVLTTLPENDSESQARFGAFREGLAKLGWTEGREVRIDYRWAAGDQERARAYAAELVTLKPDLIFAAPSAALEALRQTGDVPIVFAQVADPLGEGRVASLARPGGNVTGFALYEFAIAAKWVELLKQIAPNVTRVLAIYDPANPEWKNFVPVIETAAPSVGVQASFSLVRNRAEIERAIEEFARQPNGGLIPLPSPVMLVHRELIISLTKTYHLPTMRIVISQLMEDLHHTVLNSTIFTGAPRRMLIASSRAKSLVIFRSSKPPNSKLSSISRLPGRWASTRPCRCLRAHVRFDERGWETERCRMAQATAPILDST
jgi:putative ABC transport system substrate-binding protein